MWLGAALAVIGVGALVPNLLRRSPAAPEPFAPVTDHPEPAISATAESKAVCVARS